MTVDVRVPGDKSISHRALILSCLARGVSSLRGLPASADVRATAAALTELGGRIEGSGEARIEGPAAWRDPIRPLDCGNSGTSARLLAGLVGGLGLGAELGGDASLRRRPMDRIVYPLQAMGIRIEYVDRRGLLPLRIERRASGGLRPLRHRSRVASAQVKSAILLAGVGSRTAVEVVEPTRSRDHTERLLRHLGAPVHLVEEPDATAPGGGTWRVALEPEGWEGNLAALDLTIPGDPSSAAFLMAASLLGGAETRLDDVLLNPTRTGFLTVLAEMGAAVEACPAGERGGEPVGALRARPSALSSFRVGEAAMPWLIDEVPILAILAARARGTSVIRGAEELRVKESDRLSLLAEGLTHLGVRCRERPDGLEIEGSGGPLRGSVRTGGDHRLAMAFGVLGRLPGCRVQLDDPDCVSVSYPGFWDALDRVLPGPTASG